MSASFASPSPRNAAHASRALAAPADSSELLKFGDREFLTTITAMTTGDFNGDGWADIAIAEKDSSKVVLWLNDQTGHFSPGPVASLSGTPRGLAAADLNGDTKLDLVAALGTAGGTLALLKGDGAGGFDGPVTLPIGGTPTYLRVGRLNADALPDIVVSNSSDTTIAVLVNKGDLAFTTTHYVTNAYESGISPQGVALGDFDHDGVLDLAVASRSAGAGAVSIRLGVGDGSFGSRVEYPVSNIGFIGAVEAGDFDGDLHDDLVIAHAFHNETAVLWNNGSGAFLQQVDYPLRSMSDDAARFVVADLDGDGKLDIAGTDVRGNSGRNWISLWLNQGNRVFDTSIRYFTGVEYSGGPRPRALLSLEDVDHLGRRDLVVGLNNYQFTQLLVIRHRAGRLFDGLTDYELAGGSGPIMAVDFNATGKHDLLMSRSGHLWLLDSDANGAFAPPIDIGVGAFVPMGTPDFNRDGRTDVLQSVGPPLSISLCSASGVLQAPDTYASRYRASGDFDGDGFLDLLGEDSGGMLETLLNDGTGHFEAPVPAGVKPMGSWPIGTGDLDGDTHAEILVARKLLNTSSGTLDSLTVLRSLGDGTFAFLADYALPPDVPSFRYLRFDEVFVAYLDGDNILDAFIAGQYNTEEGVFYVLLGDGKGGFRSASLNKTTGEDPLMTLVDADHDGDLDLVVTAYSSEGVGRMQVFANRGNGTFIPYSQTSAYPSYYQVLMAYPRRAVTGDFNADGGPDVAFPYLGSNGGPAGIGVFLGSASDILTPALVSLVNATVRANAVRLEWYGASADIPAAHVQRRVGDAWSTLATILRDGTGRYVYDDRDVEPGMRYVYRLQLGDGPQAAFTEETIVEIPRTAVLQLERPTPNPSIGELHISFTLANRAPATLELTDVAGRRMRSMTIASPEPRRYTLDLSRGGLLAPGIYWVRLRQGSNSAVMRAVVLR